MKGRAIVLDTPKDRGVAAALMVDGRLEDLALSHRFDQPHAPRCDDIVTVRVTRKLPNQAAFCQLEGGLDGFLRDARHLSEGDMCLAQVASLPEHGKALTLSTRLLVKGPRLILTPGRPGDNVSRKIGNAAERDRLLSILADARARFDEGRGPDDSDWTQNGFIVRTSAKDAEAEWIAAEANNLLCAWMNLTDQPPDQGLRPGRDQGDPLSYALREWVYPRPDQILASADLAHRLRDLASAFFEGDVSMAQLVSPDPDPFETAGVHDAMRALASPEVPLGPATMIIEPTRALVAVDVNTGRDFSPAAGLKANLAAARDLPRQLRLRGLGGQIAVDFAPMPKKDRRTLEDTLKKAFRADPVETTLIGWTSMGLYEMQRKRERRPLSEVWTQ